MESRSLSGSIVKESPVAAEFDDAGIVARATYIMLLPLGKYNSKSLLFASKVKLIM